MGQTMGWTSCKPTLCQTISRESWTTSVEMSSTASIKFATARSSASRSRLVRWSTTTSYTYDAFRSSGPNQYHAFFEHRRPQVRASSLREGLGIILAPHTRQLGRVSHTFSRRCALTYLRRHHVPGQNRARRVRPTSGAWHQSQVRPAAARARRSERSLFEVVCAARSRCSGVERGKFTSGAWGSRGGERSQCTNGADPAIAIGGSVRTEEHDRQSLLRGVRRK